MALTDLEQQQLADVAKALSVTAPTEPFYAFVARTLGWASPLVAAARLANDLQDVIAGLTRARQELLNGAGSIPNYVIHQDQTVSQYLISGLVTFAALQDPNPWTSRLAHKDLIVDYLCRLGDNHDLEAIAAGLLSYDSAEAFATRGAHDQGADALSWREYFAVPDWVGGGYLLPAPGAKLFTVASAKATQTQAGLLPKRLDPKFVRELVGSWLIQRHSSGYWARDLGIRMLSPVQVALVTTYRLSEESWSLCNQLGVLVWCLPQITYLVCRHVSQAFDPVTSNFDRVAFETWWRRFDGARVAPRIV